MDQGEGDYGYLDLVLSNEEYTSIPNIQPFVAPTYSQPLNILVDATAIQVLELKDIHNKRKCIYLEYKNV